MGNVDSASPPAPPILSVAPPPPPPSQLRCAGAQTPSKWMGRDALSRGIDTFCADAGKQGTLDAGKDSISRTYGEGTNDAVDISMQWTVNPSFRATENECKSQTSKIMDGCDGGDGLKNPMNWKHGGINIVGPVTYSIAPKKDRYAAGSYCKILTKWQYSWVSDDGPGVSRKHYFTMHVTAWDSNDVLIYETPGGPDEMVDVGCDSPYTFDSFYEMMFMTPEGQKDTYIQYRIGQQSWNSIEPTDAYEVGGWDSPYSPATQQVDCTFKC